VLAAAEVNYHFSTELCFIRGGAQPATHRVSYSPVEHTNLTFHGDTYVLAGLYSSQRATPCQLVIVTGDEEARHVTLQSYRFPLVFVNRLRELQIP